MDDIDALLDARTVAVVGLSPDPGRASHEVAGYLRDHGYRIVPVNPNVEAVLGQRAYPSLAEVPFAVDLVDVFRRPEHLAGIVDEAIAKGVAGVWGQLGVVDQEAAARGRAAGLRVVMDRCLMVEHRRRRG
ncbi:MAG TPA: CoA-binding protein [Candidatus Dormibacteraeota bacterium]|nr:CoA-binding protein [Candidatus Dormibacteraeota bacterium]